MLLTDSTEVPVGNGWLYETKYDGFRCMLTWEKGEQTPVLKSRNDACFSIHPRGRHTWARPQEYPPSS